MRDGGVEKLRPGEMRIMCGNIPCGAQYHHPKEGSWNSAQQMQDKENFVVHHVFCGYLVKVLVCYLVASQRSESNTAEYIRF